jgi:hypothetical protein
MAHLLRGKQAGIQKDLSFSVAPELFALDDVSHISILCLASTDNLDDSLRGMASTLRSLPWHTIPFSHYWQLGPMTLSSVLERFTSTAKSESLRLSLHLEGLQYDSYGFAPTNS